MPENYLTVDISDVLQNFKKTLNLKSGYDNRLIIKGVDSNQVEYVKNGSNIVATVYTEGRTSIFGTITLTNGAALTGYDEKVGAYVYDSNGNLADQKFFNNFSVVYGPVKKNTTYTGTWLSEAVVSTEQNETFNLGSGNDVISYDFSSNQGKDTIILNKGENIFLNVSNVPDDYNYSYKKSGNDLLFDAITEFKNDKSLDYYRIVYKITPPETANGDYKYTYTTYALQNDFSTYNTKGTTYKGTLTILEYNYVTDYALSHNINLDLTLDKESTFYIGLTHGIKFNIPKAMENYNTITELFQSVQFNSSQNPAAISSHWNIKNYFKYEGHVSDLNSFFNETEVVNSFNKLYYDKHDATKGQTIKDTFLSDEVLIGSQYSDTITSSKGFDEITGGAGNDKIYLSGNKKYLNYGYGDGNDTLYISEGTEVSFSLQDSLNEIYYTVKGNDLVVHSRSVLDIEDSYTINLNNYFKKADKIVISGDITQNDIIKYFNETYYNYQDSDKPLSIKDTLLTETIIGGNRDDKITSAGGDDKIYGGKGNDTINLSNGSKTIYFNKEDGNDIVSVSKNASATLNMYDGDEILGLIYTKSGNNLVINRMIDDEYDETGKYTKDLTDSVTIKNYFSNSGNVTSSYTDLHGYLQTEINDFVNSGALSLYGSDTVKNTINGTKYNDCIYAGNKTTKITAGEGTNVIIQSQNGDNLTVTSGKGNDTYTLKDLTKKVTITDNGGNDSLTVDADTTGYSQHYIFDVKADGTLKDNSLKIIYTNDERYNNNSFFAYDIENNKQNFTKTYMYDESVKINNFFIKDGRTGTGVIENMPADIDFNKVRQDVASWLNANNFASVSDFFNKGAGTTEDTVIAMKDLIAIFDGKA